MQNNARNDLTFALCVHYNAVNMKNVSFENMKQSLKMADKTDKPTTFLPRNPGPSGTRRYRPGKRRRARRIGEASHTCKCMVCKSPHKVAIERLFASGVGPKLIMEKYPEITDRASIYNHANFYPEIWDKRRPDRWAWRRLDTYEDEKKGAPSDVLVSKCLDVAAKYSPELQNNAQITIKHEIEASHEFKEQFQRIRKLEQAIPAEITVENQTDE